MCQIKKSVMHYGGCYGPLKEKVRHTKFKAFKMTTTEVMQTMCKKNSKSREVNQF